jgi:hypothetical protein
MKTTAQSRFLISGNLSRSLLPLALTAEKVEFAVHHFLKHGHLLDPSRERPALERARNFLGDVKLGRELVKDAKLTSRAVEASYAYGKALDVFSQMQTRDRTTVEQDQGLDPILNGYINALDSLTAHLSGSPTEPEQTQLVQLRGFFEILRKLTFERLSAPPEKVVTSAR